MLGELQWSGEPVLVSFPDPSGEDSIDYMLKRVVGKGWGSAMVVCVYNETLYIFIARDAKGRELYHRHILMMGLQYILGIDNCPHPDEIKATARISGGICGITSDLEPDIFGYSQEFEAIDDATKQTISGILRQCFHEAMNTLAVT